MLFKQTRQSVYFLRMKRIGVFSVLSIRLSLIIMSGSMGGKDLLGSSGSHRFINVLVLVNKVLALPQNLLCLKFSVGLKIGRDPNFGIGLKLGLSIKFFVGKNIQN